ncbi:MAG: hypothetical protein JW757_05730 [Anaerolineales bacterium]|nr:hypothetical protein [Anaerolineales bacterium]
MTHLIELIKKLLRDVVLFVRFTSGIRLRKYQEAVARAVIDSVVHQKGYGFVVIFPRQSGKNELQAQLQAFLLTLFSSQPCEMVQISPTWRPQTENAMHKLESVLRRNLILRDRWEKHYGHVYQVGRARLVFLSGSPTTNIVGATANLLLSIDEAQDILMAKFDKEIIPMAASTNATRVFWGTAWTANTLLAREEKAARVLQAQDGVQRVWRLNCEQVANEVPPYGRFVADQVARLGRNHPLVKTQYFSEDIDAEGGLFPPERIALLYGTFPAQVKPSTGQVYVMTLDLAGEDEQTGQGLESFSNPARDATALTIARVNLTSLTDPGLLSPSYEIVYRQQWVGTRHTEIYGQILSLAMDWRVKYLVCDATGVGAGLTSFLARPLGTKVIPFMFNPKTKSDLGWSFLAMVDSGRLKTYASQDGLQRSGEKNKLAGQLSYLNDLFFKQLQFTEYEIQPGPEKRIAWSVPNGRRDPGTGELIHDDLVIGAAMLSLLDARRWDVNSPAAVVQGHDPLDDMKGF